MRQHSQCLDEPRHQVDDPLTGREVAGGSYRVGEVAAAFSEGARRLERMARRHAASGSPSPSGEPAPDFRIDGPAFRDQDTARDTPEYPSR